MKQVVGGAFSGFVNPELERKIINDLVSYSGFRQKSMFFNMTKIREGAKALTNEMKRLLHRRMLRIFRKVTARLLDLRIQLEWQQLENNCQAFSDNILRHQDFGSLFSSMSHDSEEPLYLISFVVRIESYDRARVITKEDIPNGLAEEYLLNFRSGRHDDSDIIDTLQEYWYDWGAFGVQLYRFQDHFPWDCTEAYKQGAPTCNNCTLNQHVWAFPFDSWSIIQLSLQKDRRWYVPTGDRTRLTDKEWLENRLRLFAAQEALLRGAVAMARTHELVSSCDWFRTSPEAQFDRLKLGGIHRAQPYSHHFEKGRFKQSLLAPWAHYTHETRVKWYEKLRDERQRMADVQPHDDSEGESLVWPGGLELELAEGLSMSLTVVEPLAAASAHHPAAVAAGLVPADPSPVVEPINQVAIAAEPVHHLANILGGLGLN